MTQRLKGLNPLSYLGVNPLTPPGFNVYDRPPTSNDSKNFLLGQIWLERNTQNLWMLTSLSAGLATWTPFGNAFSVLTLTGNIGGAVPATANNINVVGDNITIEVTGNPGTSTLTIEAKGDGLVSTLRGDDGVFILPSLGNIDVLATPTAGATVAFQNTALSTLGLLVTDVATNNTLIGLLAGNGTIIGDENTSLGHATLNALTTGTTNLALGSNSLLEVTSGIGNSASGFSCGAALVNGNNNCLFGKSSGNALVSGSNNLAAGTFSMDTVVSGSNNICLGESSATAFTTNESSNIIIGNAGTILDNNTIRIGTQGNGAGQVDKAYMAGVYQAVVGGTNEMVVVDNTGKLGSTAGGAFLSSLTGDDTIAVVPAAGNIDVLATPTAGASFAFNNTAANTLGLISTDLIDNIYLGRGSGNLTGTGNGGNVSVGVNTTQVITTGFGNLCLGTLSGRRLTTGTTNVMLGVSTGYDSGGPDTGVTTGIGNVFIGYTCGSGYTGAESHNILIGDTDGVVGESQIMRIGNDAGAPLLKSFVQGIRGVTTDVNDAIAVFIDSAGQLGTASSSARFKDNIEDMGDESSEIMNLRPVKFNYKESSALQTGLIAEEVFEVMPRLVVHDKDGLIESVKYHELPALLLNEIQKLQKRVAELEARLN